MATLAILNIGLARNDNKPDNSPELTANVLRISGVKFFNGKVEESATEQTFIVECVYRDKVDLFDVCGPLAQDCVAAYYPQTGKGELIGPNAAAWGEFNKDYFLFP